MQPKTQSRDNQLLHDLFRAYYDARKNKRSTANALSFEVDLEANIFSLYEDIVNRRYAISPSICFVVTKPVKREIFAGSFRDRVVHHLLFNYLNPIFEKHFIKDSYSCRIGKGTSYGIARAAHFMRSCSRNQQTDCWMLKLDISGYFMSMDKEILHAQLKKKLEKLKGVPFDRDMVLSVLRVVIFHDASRHCRIKGKREDWVGLPKSKSLFFAKKGKGFPIGNLTSQLFGNIYLDEFDHWMRRKYRGCARYGRYVDDMIFVVKSKRTTGNIIEDAEAFLTERLMLELHPKKIYLQHCSKGVAFLGVFIKPFRVYAGRRAKSNFYAAAARWSARIAHGEAMGKGEVEQCLCCLNSYLGIMRHLRTFALRRKIMASLSSPAFREYFRLDENCTKVMRAQEEVVLF